MFHRIGTVLLAIALLTPAAGAQTHEYEMDIAHTDIHFSVMRFGFNRVIGHFRSATGTVLYDADDVSNSSVSAEIDVASIDSGNETRDGHLAGEYWFDAANYPTMTFRTTSVEELEDGVLKVHGDLTLHGETVNVPLKVVINKAGRDPATKKEALGVTVKTHLSRSEFGMKTAGALIDDDISIHIEMLAHRK